MSEEINELVNGVISTKKLEGAETFKNAEGSLLVSADILDYWSWAYSDIVGNTNRGVLAEFIVARAIGSEPAVRNDWAAYDLETPSGIKVEVKSSAYLQSWHQTTVSAPSFSIRKAKEWSPCVSMKADRSKETGDSGSREYNVSNGVNKLGSTSPMLYSSIPSPHSG